jgi:hypothetical protein
MQRLEKSMGSVDKKRRKKKSCRLRYYNTSELENQT